MAKDDILQVEERGLRIIGGLPRLLVLDGQIVDVFDPLATMETGVLSRIHDHFPQEHFPQTIASGAVRHAQQFIFYRHH